MCGPEACGICAKLLKGIEKLYRMLRNQCLNGHRISDQWKAYISSIHKEESPTITEEFRYQIQ